MIAIASNNKLGVVCDLKSWITYSTSRYNFKKCLEDRDFNPKNKLIYN